MKKPPRLSVILIFMFAISVIAFKFGMNKLESDMLIKKNDLYHNYRKSFPSQKQYVKPLFERSNQYLYSYKVT